jgi:hypothetical protein
MEGVERIRLGENRDKWRGLVENRMKYRVIENEGNCLVSLATVSCQEEFCCMGRLYSQEAGRPLEFNCSKFLCYFT